MYLLRGAQDSLESPGGDSYRSILLVWNLKVLLSFVYSSHN